MPEKLTEAGVKALKYDGKPAVVRDAKVTGLLVAVNRTGKSCKVQRDLWQGPRGRKVLVKTVRHKNYVREHGRRSREMFVPLAHAPGHAQADFGEAMVVIGGVEQKAYFFALDLPHSDACFVRAYPAAVSEAWVDDHVHAFAFFGRVPQSVLYDNDRCLVAKILPDGPLVRPEHAAHRPCARV